MTICGQGSRQREQSITTVNNSSGSSSISPQIVDSQTSTFLFRNHPLHHLNNLSHNYNNNNNSTITTTNNNNNNSSSSGSSPQSNPANERICPHNENILKCDTCNRNLLTSNSSTVAAAAAAILAQNNHNHSSNLNLTNSQNNLNHSNHNNHHLYSHHHHNSTDYSHSDKLIMNTLNPETLLVHDKHLFSTTGGTMAVGINGNTLTSHLGPIGTSIAAGISSCVNPAAAFNMSSNHLHHSHHHTVNHQTALHSMTGAGFSIHGHLVATSQRRMSNQSGGQPTHRISKSQAQNKQFLCPMCNKFFTQKGILIFRFELHHFEN